MRRSTYAIAIKAFALSLLTPYCFAADSVSLFHRYKSGQVFQVQTHEDAKVALTLESGVNELSHTTDSVRQFRVMSVDNGGNATVQVLIENVGMRATSSEGTVTYDSKTDAKPIEQFKEVAATVGHPLAEFIVTPTGEVTSAKPLHESVNSVDASSQSLEHPFVRLPTDAVTVGDEWSEKFKLVVDVPGKLPEAVNLKRTYKLTSIDKGRATVTWRTIVLTPINDPGLEGDLAQRVFNGSFEFDIAAGHMLTRTAKAEGHVISFQGEGTKLDTNIARKESLTAPTKTAAAGSTSR